MAWRNWAPIEVHARADDQNTHDGTGYYYRPNRESPFFIQDPGDPLRFLFIEEIMAMISAEGKWLADRNPEAGVEELRAAALNRPGPYARMM